MTFEVDNNDKPYSLSSLMLVLILSIILLEKELIKSPMVSLPVDVLYKTILYTEYIINKTKTMSTVYKQQIR